MHTPHKLASLIPLAVVLVVLAIAAPASARRRRRYHHHHHRHRRPAAAAMKREREKKEREKKEKQEKRAQKGESSQTETPASSPGAAPTTPAPAATAKAASTPSTSAASATAGAGAAAAGATASQPGSTAATPSPPPAAAETTTGGTAAGNAAPVNSGAPTSGSATAGQVEEIQAQPASEPGSDSTPQPKAAASSPLGHPRQVFPLAASVLVGGSFSQVLSRLGSSYAVAVELDYLPNLPVLAQQLGIFFRAGYGQPQYSHGLTDPRVTGGSYSFKITEQEVKLSLGLLYRLFAPGTRLNFFGQAGAQLHLQKADVVGDASKAAFGPNNETATKVGLLVAAGAEFTLGPGAIAAEVDFDYSDLHHRVTGNTSAGGLGLQLGYHFLF